MPDIPDQGFFVLSNQVLVSFKFQLFQSFRNVLADLDFEGPNNSPSVLDFGDVTAAEMPTGLVVLTDIYQVRAELCQLDQVLPVRVTSCDGSQYTAFLDYDGAGPAAKAGRGRAT